MFSSKPSVPVTTQLEVLKALSQLGEPVKDHIIEATKSAFFQVRTKAIYILVNYLSDDDLFSSYHILNDRSQKTIAVYLSALAERNIQRTIALLLKQSSLSAKATVAYFLVVERNHNERSKLISISDEIVKKANKREFTHDQILKLRHQFICFFEGSRKKVLIDLLNLIAKYASDNFVRYYADKYAGQLES